MRGTVQLVNDSFRNPRGYYDGLIEGRDWALAHAPHDDVHGFPACENVKQSGFDSEDHSRGYWYGVWATWCQEHPWGVNGDRCSGTHACRSRIRTSVA